MTNGAETQFVGGDQALLATSMEMALFELLSRSHGTWLRNERADYKVRDLPYACPTPAHHPPPESANLHTVCGHGILSSLLRMN